MNEANRYHEWLEAMVRDQLVRRSLEAAACLEAGSPLVHALAVASSKHALCGKRMGDARLVFPRAGIASDDQVCPECSDVLGQIHELTRAKGATS